MKFIDGLTMVGSTFLGGASTWAMTHIDPAHIPSNEAQWGAFFLGCLVTGVTSVYHFYRDPKPQ
jgi:hypothetical protein